jgi:methylenetetrahydrofolate dehydrogenase (NADP+)/methenyltetrahydrofolate cyclohydrolase
VSARLLDGRELSRRLNGALRPRIAALPKPPTLAVVLVGSDPASQVYVRRKGEVAVRLGMGHRQVNLPAAAAQGDVVAAVRDLSLDRDVDGILVQLPLPVGLDATAVIEAIDPDKDVDGLTARNAGWLSQGRAVFVPCTPAGVLAMLADTGVSLRGARAVVIGRSAIVGRPVAQLLEQADATVTVCHSRTRDLADEVGRAEVVVAAVGRPNLVQGSWIRPGAVVIDVGINRVGDSLVGDVDTEAASARASVVTPVPGGVGPMTIAMLMRNTVVAAERRGRG